MLFTLPIFATLAVASTVVPQDSTLTKRGHSTVAGAKKGTEYAFKETSTTASCPKLLAKDVNTSLTKFDTLFPPEYDAGPSYSGQTEFTSGALYDSYPEGTFAFYLEYKYYLPNSTHTWINSGADILNVFQAVREDVVSTWTKRKTFQFTTYNVSKVVNGNSNYSGQFVFQIQTPSFVKGCDTSCGGDCDPNICQC